MKQSDAPINTKENMSCFNISINSFYDDNVLCVSKYKDETDYCWLKEKRKHVWMYQCSDIGMWRLTKKRKTKEDNWENVLESKITPGQMNDWIFKTN